MREFFRELWVRQLISWGAYNKAFRLMWVGWPGHGTKDNRCHGCGANEMHDDYWTYQCPVALRFGDQAPGRQRNPAAPDCWRLDLTEEHELQKKAFA